ncbi:hypothetical protein [Desulfoscipio geothermicus]|uniref:hypothetical protein n=1 Tax=Desulfoscipio geothermicus TaxID=39060 RepID=UPI000B890CA6|nr:hypothetical protein [Desulfoscipio geothermicus]
MSPFLFPKPDRLQFAVHLAYALRVCPERVAARPVSQPRCAGCLPVLRDVTCGELPAPHTAFSFPDGAAQAAGMGVCPFFIVFLIFT